MVAADRSGGSLWYGGINLFIKFYDYIVATVIVLDFFYNTVIGFDAVTAGVTAGHGDGGVDDVTVAAGSFPFDNLYLIAGFYKSGAFHFKFN